MGTSSVTELVNRPHEAAFAAFAADKPDVVALSGDLTNSTELNRFRDEQPARFVSMGMAEQNMISWAGGLAREGLVPYVHTFAVFIYRRAFDQLSMSVAYPNLPVKFMAFLPGLTTPGGVTHQAIDDVAALRGVPNMTILEVGDATEVETVAQVAYDINGPVFIRMLRGQVSRLFPHEEPLRLNHARLLSVGVAVTLLSSGVCTEEALRATAALREAGMEVTHLHVSTLKPFTDEAVLTACAKATAVITVENHVVSGGLGSVVAELIASNGLGTRLVRLGIKDTYSHGATLPYLMREHGLDAMGIIAAVEDVTGTQFGLSETDIQRLELSQSTEVSVDQLDAL